MTRGLGRWGSRPTHYRVRSGLPAKDLDEWEAAIDEYEAQQADKDLPEEDGNEWF